MHPLLHDVHCWRLALNRHLRDLKHFYCKVPRLDAADIPYICFFAGIYCLSLVLWFQAVRGGRHASCGMREHVALQVSEGFSNKIAFSKAIASDIGKVIRCDKLDTTLRTFIWVVVSNIFIFSTLPGEMILFDVCIYFEMAWNNQQLDIPFNYVSTFQLSQFPLWWGTKCPCLCGSELGIFTSKSRRIGWKKAIGSSYSCFAHVFPQK